ncbi:MAG: ATP-binding protein [Atopobium sp.]|uniref:ATP-binding protein n=1 Tax=Atopobium sp. TaxID=1872650 RepID=UPI002A8278BE|nr:ATP-binding protein [Atopobium sp.]MDY4522489.1 ATP-binding protein [Atopobium sp.]
MSTLSSDERAIMESIRRSKLQKAGLYGCYAEASSELGARVSKLAQGGKGAFLFGTCGTGKTYAAAEAVKDALGSSKLVTVSQLLADIRADFDENHGTLERVKGYRVLVLDDLGVEKITDWSMETLTTLIDYRVCTGKVTIFTSNYRLGELRSLWGGVSGQRLASRIAGACELIEVTGKDRRLHA